MLNSMIRSSYVQLFFPPISTWPDGVDAKNQVNKWIDFIWYFVVLFLTFFALVVATNSTSFADKLIVEIHLRSVFLHDSPLKCQQNTEYLKTQK